MTLPRRRREEPRPVPPADAALVRSMLALGTRDPSMLGHALAKAREASGLTPEQQAAELGVSVQALAYLSITRVPAAGRRAEGLAAVAGRFGVAAEALAAVLAVGQ